MKMMPQGKLLFTYFHESNGGVGLLGKGPMYVKRLKYIIFINMPHVCL